MDFLNSLFEDPAFNLVFHEIVCILGSVYYLVPTVTRLREKKEGRPFTTSWKSLKNVVGLYVVLAESIFMSEYIKNQTIAQPAVAVISQIIAVVIIFIAWLTLKEEPQKSIREAMKQPVTKHKWSK